MIRYAQLQVWNFFSLLLIWFVCGFFMIQCWLLNSAKQSTEMFMYSLQFVSFGVVCLWQTMAWGQCTESHLRSGACFFVPLGGAGSSRVPAEFTQLGSFSHIFSRVCFWMLSQVCSYCEDFGRLGKTGSAGMTHVLSFGSKRSGVMMGVVVVLCVILHPTYRR